jgi:hypothetical protein
MWEEVELLRGKGRLEERNDSGRTERRKIE